MHRNVLRSNLDEIVAVAIEAEFHLNSSSGGLSREPQNNGPEELNVSERNRLHELFVASRALVEPIDTEKNVRECLSVSLILPVLISKWRWS